MYNRFYDTDKIRNKEYSVMTYIQRYYKANDICLDLGCGSCRKILNVLNQVDCYFAIDSDKNRINVAKENTSEYRNIKLGVADNFYLPFEDNKFDLVSCFMSKYSIPETSRVLKCNGLFIIETLGANDKRDIKENFGKDELGWRGRLLYDSTDKQVERIFTSLSPFFKIIDYHCLSFKTCLKTNIFSNLLNMTNEVRNFDAEKDKHILSKLEDKNRCIQFEEERIIIVCQKYHN